MERKDITKETAPNLQRTKPERKEVQAVRKATIAGEKVTVEATAEAGAEAEAEAEREPLEASPPIRSIITEEGAPRGIETITIITITETPEIPETPETPETTETTETTEKIETTETAETKGSRKKNILLNVAN